MRTLGRDDKQEDSLGDLKAPEVRAIHTHDGRDLTRERYSADIDLAFRVACDVIREAGLQGRFLRRLLKANRERGE